MELETGHSQRWLRVGISSNRASVPGSAAAGEAHHHLGVLCELAKSRLVRFGPISFRIPSIRRPPSRIFFFQSVTRSSQAIKCIINAMGYGGVFHPAHFAPSVTHHIISWLRLLLMNHFRPSAMHA